MTYTVIIERGDASYGAYVPDLPGCVAVAETEAEVRELIGEAVAFHLEGLAAEGAGPPEPRSVAGTVETPAVVAA